MEKVNSAWGWDLLPSLCQLDASLSSPSSLTSGHSIRKQVEKELRKQSKAKKKKKGRNQGEEGRSGSLAGMWGFSLMSSPPSTVTHYPLISGNTFSTLLSFLHAPYTLILLNFFLFSKVGHTIKSPSFWTCWSPAWGVAPHSAYKTCLLFLHDSGQAQPSLMPQWVLVTLYKSFVIYHSSS